VGFYQHYFIPVLAKKYFETIFPSCSFTVGSKEDGRCDGCRLEVKTHGYVSGFVIIEPKPVDPRELIVYIALKFTSTSKRLDV